MATTHVVVDAPGFVAATDLQVRLRGSAASVRSRASGDDFEVMLETRDVPAVLHALQEWVDTLALQEVSLFLDGRPYVLQRRARTNPAGET